MVAMGMAEMTSLPMEMAPYSFVVDARDVASKLGSLDEVEECFA